jgi:hypothetical protein
MEITDDERRARNLEAAVDTRWAVIESLGDNSQVPTIENSINPSSTIPLPDLWFEFAETAGIRPGQAAELIEKLLPMLGGQICGENDFGLFTEFCGNNQQDAILCNVSGYCQNARWDRDLCAEWNFLRVRLETANALRSEIKGRFGGALGTAQPKAVASYLDVAHPRYAPKLAAAVSAWLAVDDPKGTSPKKALLTWLRAHSSEFALSDDGRPNEQGIEECAKVANWHPIGGAPKTPGG